MTDKVNFHDATLVAVRANWADGTCIVEVDHWTLGICLLTFSTMSHLTLPRKQSWGRSVSINSFSMPSSGHYEIEMQSGDVIVIEASEMVLTTSVRKLFSVFSKGRFGSDAPVVTVRDFSCSATCYAESNCRDRPAADRCDAKFTAVLLPRHSDVYRKQITITHPTFT